MTLKISLTLCALVFAAVIESSSSETRPQGNQTQPTAADTSKTGTPPLKWNEHWFEHDLTVTRTFYDNNAAIYYDDNMPRIITWPNKVISDAWSYVKKTYGNFGDSTRVYAIFHKVVNGKLGGGHPASYFDESHDFRNVIDCGLDDWTNPTGQQIGMPIHELGHIVCGASHGVKGSPSDALWGDSKFMEIFIYDVYLHIGYEAEAAKVFTEMQSKHDNFPAANTQWFKNWFYPIYDKHGKAAVLNKYFELLARYYPKKNGNEFDHDLNWGEFVHFWSGAAGINLEAQAITAFGWKDEWEAEFKKAQKDFPAVKYQ
jgi:hypothetical protein